MPLLSTNSGTLIIALLSDAQLDPFIHNMHEALWVLAATSVLGAGVSVLRPRHVREEAGEPTVGEEARAVS